MRSRCPFADGCADVVTAGELLEHVVDPRRVLAEACRLLRPGGLLVLDTINATAAGAAAWWSRSATGCAASRRAASTIRTCSSRRAWLSTSVRNTASTIEIRGLRPRVGQTGALARHPYGRRSTMVPTLVVGSALPGHRYAFGDDIGSTHDRSGRHGGSSRTPLRGAGDRPRSGRDVPGRRLRRPAGERPDGPDGAGRARWPRRDFRRLRRRRVRAGPRQRRDGAGVQHARVGDRRPGRHPARRWPARSASRNRSSPRATRSCAAPPPVRSTRWR